MKGDKKKTKKSDAKFISDIFMKSVKQVIPATSFFFNIGIILAPLKACTEYPP